MRTITSAYFKKPENKISTTIYNKENLINILQEQLDSVKKQLENDCDLIEIHIAGITIDLDYIANELTVYRS